MDWPESYLEALKRADLGTAFRSVSITGLGLLGLVGFALLLGGLVFAILSFRGKRGRSTISIACGVAALLALYGAGYAGYWEANETVKAMRAAVAPRDIENAANRIVGPLLWGGCAFGGILVLSVISLFVRKDDA